MNPYPPKIIKYFAELEEAARNAATLIKQMEDGLHELHSELTESIARNIKEPLPITTGAEPKEVGRYCNIGLCRRNRLGRCVVSDRDGGVTNDK